MEDRYSERVFSWHWGFLVTEAAKHTPTFCYFTLFPPDLSPSSLQREPFDKSLKLFFFFSKMQNEYLATITVCCFQLQCSDKVDLHGGLSLINTEQTPGKRLPIAQIHGLKHDDALLRKEARGRDGDRVGGLENTREDASPNQTRCKHVANYRNTKIQQISEACGRLGEGGTGRHGRTRTRAARLALIQRRNFLFRTEFFFFEKKKKTFFLSFSNMRSRKAFHTPPPLR